jgi:pimeloyl-ACP methyl ester carboxylesterase
MPGSTAFEKLIDVGGLCLHFHVWQGSGLTVLLEAGGGVDSSYWGPLPASLAQRAGVTVVSYDRAGFGQSDLPESPYDLLEEVGWLWRGLAQLGLAQDLILVGHSYGAWLTRLAASQRPAAVGGMVLVDPLTTEFVDLLGVDYLDAHPLSGLPGWLDPSRPEKLSKYERALLRVSAGGLGPKAEVMRRAALPQKVPVRVISSRLPFLPKPEEQRAWWLAHDQLTASIPGAVLLAAERSDHRIPIHQPEIILEAVLEVIQLAKRDLLGRIPEPP